MKNTSLTSIVIVNYNVKPLLLQCLKTIYSKNNTDFPFETIVVDNDSTDDSATAVEKEFPQVVLIKNKFNAGFPAANNQAFNIAQGSYIFMLNPDTELLDDALGKLVHYLEMNPAVDLIAPMLLNTDGSRQLSVWRFPKVRYILYESFYLNFLLGKKNYTDKELSAPFEADCFSGAAILFRKKIMDTIGQLDETMFWIEDTEFCYRANKAGMKSIYYPLAQVTHHIGQSAKKNYNVSISNQIVNKIKYFKKHHSSFDNLLIVSISLCHVLFKIVVFGLLSPFNKTYFRKTKAYLYTLPLVFNPPLGMQ